MKRHWFLFLLLTLAVPSGASAETLTGVIRNLNCGSHSFGLDVPPMTRVYTTGGTRFETAGGGKSCSDLREGDQAEVEGKAGGPGIFTASRVKTSGNLAPVKDLASNEIEIKLDQSFLMGVSQSAVMRENGKVVFKLYTLEFINTLCKDGYDCSGEGEVGMRMRASRDGKDNQILLTSKNARKPTSPVKVELYGYTVQLMEAGEDVVLLVVRK